MTTPAPGEHAGMPDRRAERRVRSPLVLCTLAILSLLGVAGLMALGIWRSISTVAVDSYTGTRRGEIINVAATEAAINSEIFHQ